MAWGWEIAGMVKIKKILFVFCTTFLVSNVYAANNNEKVKTCEKVLAAGMFNGLLEDVCGFEGGVKAHLLKLYDEGQCRKVVSQKTVDKTSKDVLLDTKKRISAYSKSTFCEENMQTYVDLKNEFNGHK